MQKPNIMIKEIGCYINIVLTTPQGDINTLEENPTSFMQVALKPKHQKVLKCRSSLVFQTQMKLTPGNTYSDNAATFFLLLLI